MRICRLREYPRIFQGGEAAQASPPGGSSACFKQHSRNSKFEWSPCQDILEICSKPKPEKPETRETKTAVLNRFPKKYKMGITGVPFGRTEVLVPPPEPHERALARGKGPRGHGGCYYRNKCNIMKFLFDMCLTWLET